MPPDPPLIRVRTSGLTPQPSPVRLTVLLPDGSESDPVELGPGAPIPARGDTVILWARNGGAEEHAVRVTDRVLTYFPTGLGAAACEVLLYTESVGP